MADPHPGRARRLRRTPLVALLPALLLASGLLVACSGDDQPAPADPGDAAREVIRDLPAAGTVEAAVAEPATAVAGEDLRPPLGLIATQGSLDSVEQHCVRDYGYDTLEPCVIGQPSSRSILLWGDSRAAMWLPAVARIAGQTGHLLTVATQAGCPPLLGVTPWLSAEKRPYVECERVNNQVAEHARTVVRPDLVILVGAVQGFAVAENGRARPLGESRPDNTWSPDPRAGEIWQKGLARTITALGDDTEVVVLGEAPYLVEDPGVCLAEHLDDPSACGVDRSVGVHDEHDAAVQETAESQGATYVSPLGWLCDEDFCPAVVDAHVTHRDTFHLNREYVLWSSRALGAALGLDDWSDLKD